MEDEKNAYYVVKRGDVIGVYRNLNDFQDQLACDPSISVFKGYCLSKEAEEYLVSHGLKNAVYSIGSTDVHRDLFGQLSVCPFQQPTSFKEKPLRKILPEKRLQNEVGGSASFSATPKHAKSQNFLAVPANLSNYHLCILEFDGASKGNPGLAGAGAVLRAEDGSVICRLREGVGIATNNVSEYRAVILGLRYALQKGFKHIRVQGDSNLVCMQVQGLWKTKNPNMAKLCKVAKELKDKFMSFEIRHVERQFNSDADAQANLAIYLKEGEVQEDCCMK